MHDDRDTNGFRLEPLFAGLDLDEYDSDGSDSDLSLQVVDSNFLNKPLTLKVVLSSPPCDDNCMVVSIYGHNERLAYCKCNDQKWTPLNVGEFGIGVKDVIFHKGKLLAINNEGQLFVFENNGVGIEIKVTEIAPTGPFRLVECSLLSSVF